MNKIQYRAINDLQVRSESEDKVIEGYFVVYNQPTELWPGYYEQIDKNAIIESLDGDIRALFDHDTSKVLGRTKSQTLTLKNTDEGLYGIIKLNDRDTEAMNLYERVKRGDIDQCSFGFFIEDSKIDYREDGTIIETIKKLNIMEVSVVTFPAYEQTSVKARQKEFENTRAKQIELWKNKQKEKIKC